MKKTLIRLAALLVAGALGVGAVVAFKQAQKSKKEQEFLAELLGDLRAVEADGAGRAYIEALARSAHDGAVAASFTPGGFMAGTYDVNTYQRTAVDAMIARARADGSTHIAEALAAFKEEGARLDLSDPGGG